MSARWARRDTTHGMTVVVCPCGWRAGPFAQWEATVAVALHNQTQHGVSIGGATLRRIRERQG